MHYTIDSIKALDGYKLDLDCNEIYLNGIKK